MLELRFTAKFKKDYKRIKKQGKDIAKLESALETLVRRESLPEAASMVADGVVGAIAPLGVWDGD